MNEDAKRDPRDQIVDFMDAYNDLVSERDALAIRCESAERMNVILSAESDRTISDNDRLSGLYKRVQRENARLHRILAGVGSLISDGAREVQAARAVGQPLRGTPTRDEEPFPRVVRAGPIRD